jgi:hypothetical protein
MNPKAASLSAESAALTRAARGGPAKALAMRNGRCRFHGGKSTRPRTPEGLARSRRANWKHGHYSRPAIEERRAASCGRFSVSFVNTTGQHERDQAYRLSWVAAPGQLRRARSRPAYKWPRQALTYQDRTNVMAARTQRAAQPPVIARWCPLSSPPA